MIVLAGAAALSGCANAVAAAAPEHASRPADPDRTTQTSGASLRPDSSVRRPIDAMLRAAVRSVPVEQLAGQLLIVGVEDHGTGRALPALDDAARAMLDRVRPAGVVLFGRSFVTVDQTLALVAEIHDLSGLPPIVATDYEGGVVARLTDTGGIPATRIPPARTVGELYASGRVDGSAVRALGEVMGRELRALGVTMNFAPVVDVDPRGELGALGRQWRTFGDDPAIVARIASELVIGMQSQGVAAIVKHFPGHGAVAGDSHFVLPELFADRELLESRELAAFADAFLADPIGLMTAHIVVPALAGNRTPATISHAVLTGLVRERFGFDGVIITDALNMRALAGLGSEADLAIAAIAAGADLLLKPIDPVAVHRAVVDSVSEGTIPRSRLEDSVVRVMRAKHRLGLLPVAPFGPAVVPTDPVAAAATLGSEEHRAIVARFSPTDEGAGE